ncbi:MAG TPA: hypothetical protein VHW23_46475 [Kofleriaceae bacterium]|nr:hypothetical protein [Kofleriaceae bacterium]
MVAEDRPRHEDRAADDDVVPVRRPVDDHAAAAAPFATLAHDRATPPFAASVGAVVADHRGPVLDDHAMVAAVFTSVVVRQGDTTRQAESKSGERKELEHHDLG